MSRTLDNAITTAIQSNDIEPFFAFEMVFSSTTLRFFTGEGDIVIGGNTYTGVGSVLSFSNVEESADIGAKSVSITLSGIPSSNLSLALSTPYQGREVTIHFGIKDANRTFLGNEDGTFILTQLGALIDITASDVNPNATSVLFVGYIDQMDIQEGAETSSITVRLESKLLQMERQRVLRYTSAIQKSLYSGDKGFDFVDQLQGQTFIWGRSETQ
jgi:hypothetical protein|tara:strand:- start:97 stop:741 length:645 start_codon:yes stop_codon:yes gene_type:complete